MSANRDSFREALLDPAAQEVRCKACRICADQLKTCGDALWAFGMADNVQRRALATVLQMAGSLAKGSVAMLEANNWYAAAALSRQLVEVEYLVWLFGSDPDEAGAWLTASQQDLRNLYNPSAMRKHSKGQFRDQEYWSHCEIGGHPSPKGAFLLPERAFPDDGSPLPTPEWMWVDLGQHLERLWEFADVATQSLELDTVRAVENAKSEVESVLQSWHKQDACADRLSSFPE